MNEATTEQLDNYGDVSAIGLLTDPKLKLTARGRRKLNRMRHKVYTETPAVIEGEQTWTTRQQPKDGMLRLTQALAKRSARRLVRIIKQSARRASTAKHLLAKMAKDSKFRPAIEESQKFNIIAFVAGTTELENRGKIGA